MERLTIIVRRIFFVVASILAGLVVWEKIANNLFGLTFLGAHDPWRILELSVVALLFVIVLQLREIKTIFGAKESN